MLRVSAEAIYGVEGAKELVRILADNDASLLGANFPG